DAGVALDVAQELVVGEREHPAVGVVDQHDLLRPEQALRDRERPDRVVGDDAARVADDVRVSLREPQEAVDVEARVHAGDDRDLASRRRRQASLVEPARVGLGVSEQLVGRGHRTSSVGEPYYYTK